MPTSPSAADQSVNVTMSQTNMKRTVELIPNTRTWAIQKSR